VFVAEKVGVTPETGLLNVSLRVIVIVEVSTPSATTGVVPVILEFPASGPVGWKTTLLPVTATGDINCNVLVSAVVDASVQVEIPEALVAEQAP
jgi:hypothetical protein